MKDWWWLVLGCVVAGFIFRRKALVIPGLTFLGMMSWAAVDLAFGVTTNDSEPLGAYVMIMGLIFGVAAFLAVAFGMTARWIVGRGQQMLQRVR